MIETKLAVNNPGDEFEQDANRVSEQVMRMPESKPEIAGAVSVGYPKRQVEQPGTGQEVVQRKPVEAGAAAQAMAQEGGNGISRSSGQSLDPATRVFMGRRFGRDFSPVRVHSDGAAEQSGEAAPETSATPQAVRTPREASISPQLGGGRSLDEATRAFMEPRFGWDFGHVRIHEGPAASAAAHAVDALAFTAGSHIVFGAGQFQPRSEGGRRLLAHELAHVVQQDGPAPAAIMRKAGTNCTMEECGKTRPNTVRADIGRAITYTERAIKALDATPLPDGTARALRWYFAGDAPDIAGKVKTRLGCILECLRDTQTNDRFGCDPNEVGPAYTELDSPPICSHVQATICFNEEHFGTGDAQRAKTVIHECAHRVGMSRTQALDFYADRSPFKFLDTEEALRNSDSFAMFAAAISDGVPVSFDKFALVGGGLSWAPGSSAVWNYRVYGGVDLAHPRLWVFSPTLGLAYTFLGAPDTSNPAAPQPQAEHLLALLGGVELGNPRPAQGWHASLFGGPSISISNTSGGTKLGIEAGAVLGYRWRTIDISVGLGYDHDPKREAGERDIFSGTVNLDLLSVFKGR